MNYEVTRSRGYAICPVYVNTTDKPVGCHESFNEESWVYATKAEASQKLHELKLMQLKEVEEQFESNLDKLQKIKK